MQGFIIVKPPKNETSFEDLSADDWFTNRSGTLCIKVNNDTAFAPAAVVVMSVSPTERVVLREVEATIKILS